ncbi:MAG: ERCC4 domain-containing protein, partial [Paludibacter sp.]|nr:ERCC4 domain-containing protein [Paludibacter sp.]
MIDCYRYTDTEIKKLLKSLTIVIDTREQENSWIIDYFDKKKIPYKTMKLDEGDYSAFIPANSELGILRDTYFDKKIVLERKNSIDELSGTISTRDRFESELLRSKDKKFILMVEETSGWEKIVNHKYNSQYNEKAFLATLFTFSHRYNIDINFIDKR